MTDKLVYKNEKDKNEKTKRQPPPLLEKYFDPDPLTMEIGVDEVGRGPLFGRVYAAAVVLPKDDSFDHSRMKDSKKFSSTKKRAEVAAYIKEHALCWSIQWIDESTIDTINILQASQEAMRKSISQCLDLDNGKNLILLIDGNYFKPFPIKKEGNSGNIAYLEHHCIEGGDNKYTSIAAASILAKVARDEYIEALCKEYPYLVENYGIDSNKGYGSKKHLQGIQEFGITQWHRRTFGICRNYA
jgi:ribonuclease HII